MEVEKFQGSAFYLKNETVKDCIEKIYNTVKQNLDCVTYVIML